MDKQIADTRQEMRDMRQEMREQFTRIDAKFDKVDAKFDKLDTKFDKLDTKIDKTGINLGEKIDRSRSDMVSLLSWQTGFVGVMLVILGLVVSWVRH